ncbi:hypothetical protein [Fusobacterium polymorphum]|uniref:hypothetical protein n=1 Tax=Fusobacterium nucleatum subsp. polymorphum TaxID=76857 RepID=UPI000BFCF80A|nr:hypothetical protein [Fusobacterium polymorphum]PHI05292.1 hypothetical protein CA845_10085 [Fusobacterium polymorphum]
MIIILEKVNELLKKGVSFKNIAENIILNYSAINNNDLIYEIKKYISEKFNVDLMHIHLIGSSHTGFSKYFIEKEGKDYDFCIVDSKVFQKYLLKINTKQINKNDLDSLFFNLKNGKIHYLYIDKDLKNEISQIMEKIRIKLKIEKQISICIYISEEAFIKNISKFWENMWIKQKTVGRATIEPLPELTSSFSKK